MPTEELLVLPRPGADPTSPPTSIPAPTESSFVSIFGSLLPKAQYLTIPSGTFAYYSVPPAGDNPSKPRILLLHGVQTPAIGLIPLTRALRTSLPDAHFVLLDWWGHGLSSTPVQAHEPNLFVSQVDSLLSHLSWPSAHIVTFSFGCSAAASFTARHRERVLSLSLVAPAGLMRSASWGQEANEILDGGKGEGAARDWALDFLEGGKLIVPGDWQERVTRGEVVAEKVREWQMVEHKGHEGSVVAIFRDGGVSDKHHVFREVARQGTKTVVVLGEEDQVCSKKDVEEIGFKNVKVIDSVGHGVVRQKAEEVAIHIVDFWKTIGL
ncbi:Alpha/Beta hydrolase protein [Elsinoe ampelina]|uniref:Alpha/Beta hydrolase protein n=1 Tax=Elsinoe ampelina TaxID=302913 RepID=A0A6A6GCF6_9PEZI|nr:Alpha/Beta hydrolase protein [Elsinoe ampelina]